MSRNMKCPMWIDHELLISCLRTMDSTIATAKYNNIY